MLQCPTVSAILTDMNTHNETTHAVIYCSAGCLPDSDYPEFVGTLSECEDYIETYAHEYERPEVEHDLYRLEIIQVEHDQDADCWSCDCDECIQLRRDIELD